MHRLSRPALSLGCLVLLLADWLDWGGPWLGLLALTLGVGIVASGLHDRSLSKADELSTLNIPR
jgi:hypothetical protein